MIGPTSPGDIDDPVAQSIRNEQRHDTSPSAAEAREDHRRHLASEGCEVCDCDDPDRLEVVQYERFHGCPNGQHPDDPFDRTILCDEHRRPAGVFERARMVQDGRNSLADFLVRYDCGNVVSLERPDPDPDDFPGPHTPRPEPAEGPLTCPARGRCDAVIDEVIPVDTSD